MKKSARMLGIAGALLLALGSTQASATTTTVNKGTYDFTYDNDFWGIGWGTTFDAATLTFNDMGWGASTFGPTRGGTSASASAAYTNEGWAAIVTPHAGYQLTNATSGFIGTYTLSPGTANTGFVSESTSISSTWEDQSWNIVGSSSSSQWLNAGPASGNYDQSATATLGGMTESVQLYYYLTGWVNAGGSPGAFSAVTHDTSYFAFTVTPVPEPETYAMLLAGLGLIGFTARRRKQDA